MTDEVVARRVRVRRALMYPLAFVLVACAWELYKWVGPAKGGEILGMRLLARTDDRAMPHVWKMVQRLGRPEVRVGDDIWLVVTKATWYSFRVALAAFLVLVMLMIWAYFREFKMSVAAIVALIHDLILTVGIYALIGFTVTPASMIGVLTILGYSLYDTVVVFDKVRENVRDLRNSNRSYSEAANAAVNQVLVRSLNTTVIGVLPVAALLAAGALILGTGPLKDLGLALFVGMIAGAYSSIFIATPLLAQMKEAEPEMRQHRDRLARRRDRVKSRVTVSVDPETQPAPTAQDVLITSTPEAKTVIRVQPSSSTRSERRK